MGDFFIDAVTPSNYKTAVSYTMPEALAMLEAMVSRLGASKPIREVETTPKGLPTEFGQRKIKA